jgi:hypothetical protein
VCSRQRPTSPLPFLVCSPTPASFVSVLLIFALFFFIFIWSTASVIVAKSCHLLGSLFIIFYLFRMCSVPCFLFLIIINYRL